MTTLLWLLGVAAAAFAGYGIGRGRLGQRLDVWADRQVDGPHDLRWFTAQAFMAGELAYLRTAHPRRTLDRLREARQSPVHAPAPVYDSQRINKRRESEQ